MKKENWISRLDMKSWFFIIGLLLLYGMNQIKFDPTKLILILASIFLVFPLTLLGMFIHPKVRKAIKEHYWTERECTLAEINELRKKQGKTDDIEEQISMDQDILTLREGMRGFKDNRFERCIFYSFVLFIISISLVFLDLGKYIQTQNTILMVIFFLWGLYYIFYMVQSIFFSFDFHEK